MFYLLLGMLVWKAVVSYLRLRYGRQLRTALMLGVLGVGVAGYLAARSGD